MLSDNITLTANFERDPNAAGTIVINEINYHSSPDFDPDDWIELHNPTDETVDISDWVFLDQRDAQEYTVPQSITIGPMGYLVFCRNRDKFHVLFPDIENYIGDLGFGLNNGGEIILLYNRNGVLVDSVFYYDTPPWPVQPDGNGPTLMLSDPHLDNSNPKNWIASHPFGTPGEKNEMVILPVQKSVSGPYGYSLDQNMPNPFNTSTRICYSIQKPDHVTLKIFDVLGREIFTLVDGFQQADRYSVNINARELPSGLYYYRLKTGNGFTATQKMLLIR
ncbi:lamin tail domain-containing protein [candidate division KSB1 bacterium]|nr:lamin tail domain-containing protein [candidate division KSB1 bacterium]